jgi:hypothetical protein
MWIQLLTGVAPTDGQTITGGISTATVDVNVTVTERALSTPFVGQSTGSALIGSYGLSLETSDLSNTDTVFDLTNSPINPPNNVTFTVGGLEANEDYVLVTNDSSGIDFTQMRTDTAYTTASVTSISIDPAFGTAPGIPSDTPTSGTIRIERADGLYSRHPYSARDLGTDTFTITSHDFDTNNAPINADVFISYIDKLHDGTPVSGEESFTTVYNGDRTLFIRVRDGGTAGDTEGIKTAETTGTLGSNGGSVTINRITDV